MKKYVITGATSGIGNSLVREFSKCNKVFAGYRDSKKIEQLKSISDNIIPFYIDMTDFGSIINAAEFIKDNTDRVDTLINVAGSVLAGPIENLDIRLLQRQFDVNTFSHLQLTQNLLPVLEGGRIINISSMSSFGIFPFISPYSASKLALDILFNSMLLETKRDIKIISIKPGAIATPIWEKSVNENLEHLTNNIDFVQEMKFLQKNALKNAEKGLSPQKVVDVVIKADSLKNPKTSYTLGTDAFIAELIAKLPQDISNKLVKAALKFRM